MTAGLLHDLTRPELDALMRTAEAAERAAQQRLSTCPLDAAQLADAAGVAQDCRCWAGDCYDESIGRMLAGETP